MCSVEMLLFIHRQYMFASNCGIIRRDVLSCFLDTKVLHGYNIIALLVKKENTIKHF